MTDLPDGLSTACVLNTPEGLAPLAWLQADDLIETLDHSFQPITRIDPVPAGPATQIDGVCGQVLAGQRLLARGWAIQMYFGVDEMLAHAGDISPPCNAAQDQTYAQIIMAKPMLLRVNDIWIESHGHHTALHPVLSPDELHMTKRAFGCPLARDPVDIPQATPPDWADVSTTFGSRSAVA